MMDYEFITGAPLTEEEALAQVATLRFHGFAFDLDTPVDEELHWHEFDSISWVISGTGSFAECRPSAADDPRYGDINDLPKRVRKELEEFFITTSRMSSKEVTLEGWDGPKAARAAIDTAAQEYIRRGAAA